VKCSDQAAEVNASFVLLIASCQLHGLEPWAYLRGNAWILVHSLESIQGGLLCQLLPNKQATKARPPSAGRAYPITGICEPMAIGSSSKLSTRNRSQDWSRL
jgi:hypothetical protein